MRVSPVQSTEPTMTIRQLRDRLTAIIEECERVGRTKDLDCPVGVRVAARPEVGELDDGDRYYLINYARSGLCGVPDGDLVVLESSTRSEVGKSLHPTRRRRRQY